MRVVIISVAFLLLGCANQIFVQTDYDRSVDLSKLNKYRWLDNTSVEEVNLPLDFNTKREENLKRAVNKQLKAKGYTLSDEGAMILVHYFIVIENKTAIRTEPFGYFYTPYWEMSSAEAVRYQEGTLIIDLMDSRTCTLLWRGSAMSVLDENNTMTDDLIRKAVEKIFESLPVSPKGAPIP